MLLNSDYAVAAAAADDDDGGGGDFFASSQCYNPVSLTCRHVVWLVGFNFDFLCHRLEGKCF